MNTQKKTGTAAFRSCMGFALAGLCLLGNQSMRKAIADSSPASDPQVVQVAAANTDFGFRLLSKLNHVSDKENVFFSPISVTQALSLALNGAGGDTEKEISATLGLQSLSLDQVNHGNGLLLPSITNPDPQVELTIANALWADDDTHLAPPFKERCHKFYAATADTLDFRSSSAAQTINDWVKNKTHDKIDKLVSSDDLLGSPAVLTNAVYFHGQWSKQFDKTRTKDGPFTLSDGSTKSVPLMSQSGNYDYMETPQFQAASLPYGSGRMSLYIILPKSGNNIDDVVKGLNPKNWDDYIGQMHSTEMGLVLPRFSIDYSTELKAPLSELGMKSAFWSGADFTPMGLSRGFIGDVVHKAIIEVNEEGTVAVGATGVIMRSLAIRRTVEMRVDHPFFCAIRDNETGTVLFMGIIRNP